MPAPALIFQIYVLLRRLLGNEAGPIMFEGFVVCVVLLNDHPPLRCLMLWFYTQRQVHGFFTGGNVYPKSTVPRCFNEEFLGELVFFNEVFIPGIL